jgi:hypothetical protein
MLRLHKLFALALLGWPFLAPAQTPDLARVLDRLDRLERENQRLAEEVASLRARLDASSPPAASPDTSPPPAQTADVALEERVEVQERRTDELSQTKVEASQKFPLRLTGMLLVNAYTNSRQSGAFDYPVTAQPTGPREAGATVKQSIFGLDFRGPTSVGGGSVHGYVFVDLYSNPFVTAPRIRTAAIEISWKTRSFMAGVEKPIFNPREPTSLAQVGISPFTGAGNLWQWLPQARFEQDLAFGRSSGLRAVAGVLQTRESAPAAGFVLPGPVEAARPAFEGRFEAFHRIDDDRRIEIAPGFHTSTTHVGGISLPSRVFSTDWFMNPWRFVEFTGAFYTGKNVAPLGNGYGQGFWGTGRSLSSVESIGGWGQLTFHVLPRLDLHLFTGQQDDRNSRLAAGRVGKNIQYGGNFYFRLAPNVLLGPEITQVRTLYIGQGLRINNHYDLALAYSF